MLAAPEGNGHPSELIDQIVVRVVKPFLGTLGFKTKSSTFFRQNGSLTEIVSSQKSLGNNAEGSRFTINLGVYWPSVQETLRRTCATFPPKEHQCTVRRRLGSLFTNGNDFWWRVTSASDVQAIGAEVIEKIQTYALPWFERASSASDAAKMASPVEAAVLLAQSGQRAEAARIIEEALARNKHAHGFLTALAAKLDLPISAPPKL